MNIKKIFMNFSFIFISILIFSPILFAFVFNIKIAGYASYFTLSVYGIYILFYMSVQILFSYLNKRKIENIEKDATVS